jgi:uncharacterized protein YerC
MPQISKRKVDQETLSRLGQLLMNCVVKLKTKQEAADFLGTLLTQTEKIMVVKRLGIAILILKGYENYSIEDVLKVSETTINTVKKELARSPESFRRSLSQIVKKDQIKKIFLKIEAALDIVPPRRGSWQEWGKEKWQRKMELQKPF